MQHSVNFLHANVTGVVANILSEVVPLDTKILGPGCNLLVGGKEEGTVVVLKDGAFDGSTTLVLKTQHILYFQ